MFTMSKSLILYKSNKGMTKKLAYLLNDKITSSEVFDLDDFNGEIDVYDNIIIGSPIYIGKINKKVKKYINENLKKLMKKNVYCFFSGMNFKEEENVIKLNFDPILQEKFEFGYLGGSYQFDKMNFIQRLIVKKIAGESESKENILEEKVNYLVKKQIKAKKKIRFFFFY